MSRPTENGQKQHPLFLSSLLLCLVADLRVASTPGHEFFAGRLILGCRASDSQQGGGRPDEARHAPRNGLMGVSFWKVEFPFFSSIVRRLSPHRSLPLRLTFSYSSSREMEFDFILSSIDGEVRMSMNMESYLMA